MGTFIFMVYRRFFREREFDSFHLLKNQNGAVFTYIEDNAIFDFRIFLVKEIFSFSFFVITFYV